MRAIILEATLTGATGESSPVPGAIGVIVGGWLDYVGQSGNTADVTLVGMTRINAARAVIGFIRRKADAGVAALQDGK